MGDQITFLRDNYLYGALFFPFFALAYLFVRGHKNQILRQYFSHIKRVVRSVQLSLRAELVSYCFKGIGFLLLIIAISGPQYGKKEINVEQKGIDIVIALDVSKSMDAEDIKPSRISRAKLELAEFVAKLRGDRVGIVTFAGKSIRNSPLTSDYSALEMFIKEIDTNMIQYQGTDLSGAVKKALESFSDKNAKGRAVILISDGENHDRDLDNALSEANKREARIYSVGVGTLVGAPIPVKGRGFKRNDSGNVILSKLEPKLLKDLSVRSGGQYFQGANQGYQLDRIYQKINSDIEKVLFSKKKQSDLIDRYQVPLIIAIVLLIIEFIISRKTALTALIPFLFIYSNPVHASFFSDVFTKLYQEKRYQEGEEYIKNRAIETQSKKDLYNLGAAFYQQDKYTEAKDIFRQVKMSDLAEEQIKGAFGLGNTHFLEKNFDSAIKEYEYVLSVDPNDGGAKKNLELAKKMKENQKSQQNDGQSQDKKNNDQSQKLDKNNKQNDQSKSDKQNDQSKSDKQNDQSKSDKQNDQSKDKKGGDQSQQQKPGEQQKMKNEENSVKEQNEQVSKKEKQDDEKNNEKKKTSFRSRMLLDQVDDSRKKYQKNQQMKNPQFNRRGENDW